MVQQLKRHTFVQLFCLVSCLAASAMGQDSASESNPPEQSEPGEPTDVGEASSAAEEADSGGQGSEVDPSEQVGAQTAEDGSAGAESSDEPEVPESASAATVLSFAEEATTDINYARSRRLAERAIGQGGLSAEELTRAYRVLALSLAQLDQTAAAEQAFIKLLALDPKSDLTSRLSPQRRTPMLSARGFWTVRSHAFGMDVSYGRHDQQVVVRVHDPLGWAKTVHVWSRFGSAPYTQLRKSIASELVFDVGDAAPTDPVEVYAFVVDQHDNVILQFGRERQPHLFTLSRQDLDALMLRDIRGGQSGSYARRLEELGVEVGVHGYLSLELKPVDDQVSFDLHHATTMIRADLLRSASLELALEWEHTGPAQGDFYIPHAFIDIAASELLIFRAGFFEVPIGAFNEYLYPDFLRITGQPPLFSRSVVPALWSEVGIEARGRLRVGKSSAITYAGFVSNGLEQPDDDPTDGVIAEGGDIRSMRFNDRDAFNDAKSGGGRLGAELGGFDLGVSAYAGRYTIEGNRILKIVDADVSYRDKLLTVRAEGALALQETTSDTLEKSGLYVLTALRPIAYLEPYLQYDYLNLGGREHRGMGGFAFYPFPNDRATRSLRLKSEAGAHFVGDADPQFVWFFQLTTGF